MADALDSIGRPQGRGGLLGQPQPEGGPGPAAVDISPQLQELLQASKEADRKMELAEAENAGLDLSLRVGQGLGQGLGQEAASISTAAACQGGNTPFLQPLRLLPGGARGAGGGEQQPQKQQQYLELLPASLAASLMAPPGMHPPQPQASPLKGLHQEPRLSMHSTPPSTPPSHPGMGAHISPFSTPTRSIASLASGAPSPFKAGDWAPLASAGEVVDVRLAVGCELLQVITTEMAHEKEKSRGGAGLGAGGGGSIDASAAGSGLQGQLSEQEFTAVGRWGERLVYRYLLSHPDVASGKFEVSWVNHEGESGAPFDLVLRPSRAGTANSKQQPDDPASHPGAVFIEVKSTRTHDKVGACPTIATIRLA